MIITKPLFLRLAVFTVSATSWLKAIPPQLIWHYSPLTEIDSSIALGESIFREVPDVVGSLELTVSGLQVTWLRIAMDFMTHVQSNTGEHVIWGSFETNPYHGTLYLSRGSTYNQMDSKKASMYVWSRHSGPNEGRIFSPQWTLWHWHCIFEMTLYYKTCWMYTRAHKQRLHLV